VETILQKVADELVSKLKNYSKENQITDAWQFEKGIATILAEGNKQFMQAVVGESKGENSKVKVKTTFGEIVVPKSHPMSSRPMGFGISPRLQEHMCRLGSKLTFAEGSEEFRQFLDIDISDKQIERVSHCYGEKLEELDWENAYCDSVQMKINYKEGEPVYAMVDGSMLLTREEKWKEVKVGRVFGGNSLVEVSKKRNILTNSVYKAHMGKASEFWERFSVEIPRSKQLVFINDGARWIWNYIEERYPNSIQILDFFHCKEHICQFAKEFFGNTQQASDFSEQLCNMLLEEKVDGAIETIRGLEPQSKKKHDEKEKLLGYLETNKKRINYGRFKKMGLLIGSGPIESAQRNVVQKRMKQSGQRWTIRGAQQIVNLRVCHQSNKWEYVTKIIKNAA